MGELRKYPACAVLFIHLPSNPLLLSKGGKLKHSSNRRTLMNKELMAPGQLGLAASSIRTLRS